MASPRHFLLGAVGLVKGKVRNDGAAMVAVCDALEPQLAGCLVDAPFETISLIVRYGTEETNRVEIGAISRKHSELPVAVQVDIGSFQVAQSRLEDLQKLFQRHSMRALRAVADEFNLDHLRQITKQNPTM